MDSVDVENKALPSKEALFSENFLLLGTRSHNGALGDGK